MVGKFMVCNIGVVIVSLFLVKNFISVVLGVVNVSVWLLVVWMFIGIV